jgi:hypothetical protein
MSDAVGPPTSLYWTATVRAQEWARDQTETQVKDLWPQFVLPQNVNNQTVSPYGRDFQAAAMKHFQSRLNQNIKFHQSHQRKPWDYPHTLNPSSGLTYL